MSVNIVSQFQFSTFGHNQPTLPCGFSGIAELLVYVHLTHSMTRYLLLINLLLIFSNFAASVCIFISKAPSLPPSSNPSLTTATHSTINLPDSQFHRLQHIQNDLILVLSSDSLKPLTSSLVYTGFALSTIFCHFDILLHHPTFIIIQYHPC